MATTRSGAVATVTLAAVMMTAGPAWSDALTAPDTTVVLHVTDLASVPAEVLTEAKGLVGLVYRAIAVEIVWTQGAAALAPADGALHFDVLMLAKDAVRHKCLENQLGDDVLGSASEPARRAHVFFGRIANRATLTSGDVSLLLGFVIAHEVGHLLLPAFSHSRDGLMRAHWQGRLSSMPGFTDAQGTTIRARLATRMHEPTE